MPSEPAPEQKPTGGRAGQRRDNRTIGMLQAGRAVAACGVLAYHAAYATRDFAAPVSDPVFRMFEHGAYGVDFFFVLSGFIILYAHGDDPSGWRPALAYLRKRLTRIFVPYLPVSLAMIGLYFALPGVSGSARDWSLLTSLTLLPTGSPPALAAAWTLVHEMMFYGLFAVSYFTRAFPLIVATWLAAIGLGMAADLQITFSGPSWINLLAPINIGFVAGLVSAYGVRHVSSRWALPSLALGLAGIAAYFMMGVEPTGPGRPLLGIAFASVVAGVTWLERDRWLACPAWLLLIGNASYAIYLVHGPLASVGARVIGRLGSPGGWPLSVMACTAIGIAGGLIYHLGFEKHALALVRGGNPPPREPYERAA